MYSDKELTKIDARKCTIASVDKDKAKEFLNNHHDQGYAFSSIRYGLYYNDELVQLMTFGNPRYNKSYQYEIIRECTKGNVVVRGGTSKLWKHFIRENEVYSCICYSYPHNGEYTDHYCRYCGFNNITRAYPEKKVFFVGNWNGKRREISKSILERHGVDRLLKTNQGKDRSNEQIMLDLGFEKEIRDGLSPQVDAYFIGGCVYKIYDDTGRYLIGCSINTPSNPDRFEKDSTVIEVIKDGFISPDDMFSYALNKIRRLAYKKVDKSYQKIDEHCLNTGLGTDEYSFCPICGGRRGKHRNICQYYNRDDMPKFKLLVTEKANGGFTKARAYEEINTGNVVIIGSLKNSRFQWQLIDIDGVDFSTFWNYILNAETVHSFFIDFKDLPDGVNPKELGFNKTDVGWLYYPFHVLYRTDDLTDGSFYIGMCESEIGWNNGYSGSGATWRRHKKKHPGHEYKRTIISNDFSTPDELREAEIREIEKYCTGGKIDKKTGCKNTHLRTQGDPWVPPICTECGLKGGHHKRTCSKCTSICECCGGTYGAHKKGCIHYKPIKCKYCGVVGGHSKSCSLIQKLVNHETSVCSECGGRSGAHKITCSKYIDRTCTECGGKRGIHKKGCSKYISEVCPECGGERGKHRNGCSKSILCPECGATGGRHKRTCSKFNKYSLCPECGCSYGKHLSSCSKTERCPECGYIIQSNKHAKTCSKYVEVKTQDGVCPECGYKIQSHQHAPTCSKYKQQKACPECGGIGGKHKGECSRRKAPEPCEECGGRWGHHKRTCSHYSVNRCPICGGAYGSHKSTCPKYKPRGVCPECGSSLGKHKSSCSKYVTKECPECGLKAGKHKKTCSRYKNKNNN